MASTTPIPVKAFLAKIRGTSEEVWSALLAGVHKAEKHTEAEWRKLIADYGKQPASPNVK